MGVEYNAFVTVLDLSLAPRQMPHLDAGRLLGAFSVGNPIYVIWLSKLKSGPL